MKLADVKLETEDARVIYDDARQTPERLAAAVDRLGFQASVVGVTAAPRPTLYVEGLSDQKAVTTVERALKKVPGVKWVIVDPRDGEVFVTHGPGVQAGDFVAALEAAGFKARPAPR